MVQVESIYAGRREKNGGYYGRVLSYDRFALEEVGWKHLVNILLRSFHGYRHHFPKSI